MPLATTIYYLTVFSDLTMVVSGLLAQVCIGYAVFLSIRISSERMTIIMNNAFRVGLYALAIAIGLIINKYYLFPYSTPQINQLTHPDPLINNMINFLLYSHAHFIKSSLIVISFFSLICVLKLILGKKIPFNSPMNTGTFATKKDLKEFRIITRSVALQNKLLLSLSISFITMLILLASSKDTSLLLNPVTYLLFSSFFVLSYFSSNEIFKLKPSAITHKGISEYLEYYFDKFIPTRDYTYLGKYKNWDIGLIGRQRFQHLNIVAKPGKGKTQSLTYKILHHQALHGDSSIVVIDTKSPEILNEIGPLFTANGKKVIFFDPWDERCVGFDPLHNADDSIVHSIVDSFIGPTAKLHDQQAKFFAGRTQTLIEALIRLNMTFDKDKRYLPAAYDLLWSVEVLQHYVDQCTDELVKSRFHDILHRLNKSDLVNALQDARNKMYLFEDEHIKKAFSRSDFTLDMLFREGDPTLLIIGVPNTKRQVGLILCSLMLRLIMYRAFEETTYIEKLKSNDNRKIFNPPPLVMLLEEFLSLFIPDFDSTIHQARYTKTEIITIVQNIKGFQALYGMTAGDMIAEDFGTTLYLPGQDNDTCEDLSIFLGKKKNPTFRLYDLGLLGQKRMVDFKDEPIMSPDDIRRLKTPGKKKNAGELIAKLPNDMGVLLNYSWYYKDKSLVDIIFNKKNPVKTFWPDGKPPIIPVTLKKDFIFTKDKQALTKKPNATAIEQQKKEEMGQYLEHTRSLKNSEESGELQKKSKARIKAKEINDDDYEELFDLN